MTSTPCYEVASKCSRNWIDDKVSRMVERRLTLTHILTESLARACAQSRLPALCASSTHAAVSSSVK